MKRCPINTCWGFDVVSEELFRYRPVRLWLPIPACTTYSTAQARPASTIQCPVPGAGKCILRLSDHSSCRLDHPLTVLVRNSLTELLSTSSLHRSRVPLPIHQRGSNDSRIHPTEPVPMTHSIRLCPRPFMFPGSRWLRHLVTKYTAPHKSYCTLLA